MLNAIYDQVRDNQIKEEVLFILSHGFDLENLKASLARVGQISPLVLRADRDGFDLVCGYRRRLALRELGVKVYSALILPENTPEQDMLAIALEDNLGARTMNEAEKALALGHLLKYLPEDRVMGEYMPRLGLPPVKKFLSRYTGLLSLGPEVLLAAANGTMDPETAEMLLDLDETDRIAALSLFNAVNPGANKRRQIITLLKEISLREDKSVAEILGEEAVSAIWRNSELNRQVREQRVRDYLFNRRYPLLSRARQEQKRIIRDLNLPPNFQIQPSPNFEGLDFRLEFSFAGQAELDRAGKTIEVLSGLPAMLKLLELG